MNRTEQDLADFLSACRAGAPPLAALDCGRAAAFSNPLSCSTDHATQLARIANRPLPGLTLYKFGSRSIVGSYFLTDGTPVVLKYYYPSSLFKHVTYGIAGSRCMQSWISALAFRFLDLPTPDALVIAEWELLGGLWLSKSFLATCHAPGIRLNEWVDRHAGDTARLDAMVGRLREIFAKMAAHRIGHGDLKATNLLISENDNPSFVDLDAATILATPAQWPAIRLRDERIFAANWKNKPEAAQAFREVFKT